MRTANLPPSPTSTAQSERPSTSADALASASAIVSRIAHGLSAKTGVDADDLWGVGVLGALEAARRFDDARGMKREVWVAHGARNAMLDELRRLDHLPRRLRTQSAATGRARAKLSHALGRAPTRAEVAAVLDLAEADVAAAEQASAPATHLSADSAIAARLPNPTAVLEAREACAAVVAALALLSDREQRVMALRFTDDLNLREIGQVLLLSEARVCQILGGALEKLRAQVGAPRRATPPSRRGTGGAEPRARAPARGRSLEVSGGSRAPPSARVGAVRASMAHVARG